MAATSSTQWPLRVLTIRGNLPARLARIFSTSDSRDVRASTPRTEAR